MTDDIWPCAATILVSSTSRLFLMWSCWNDTVSHY